MRYLRETFWSRSLFEVASISCIINLVLYWNVLLVHCEAIVVLVQVAAFVLGNHDRLCLVVELPHW